MQGGNQGQVEEVSYGRKLTLLAGEKPSAPAVVHVAQDGSELVVTWGELEARANQVARLLESRGAGQGSLVAIALPNRPEHFFATYGAWKVGATVLPMRWDLPTWERDRLLGLARPAVLVGTGDDGPGDGTTVVTVANLQASTELDATPLPDRVANPARAIATSGSTGSPKLIVAPVRGIVDDTMMRVMAESLVPGTDPRQLVISPLYHTNGFSSHLWLQGGRSLVVMERFDPALAVDLIERHRVTHATLVPTMLQRIARVPGVGERDFSSVQMVLYGGAPIPPWVVRAWFDLVGPEHFTFSYGGTEAIGIVRCLGTEWLEHEGTVGRPLDCEVRILDDDGAALPPGEVGDIYLRHLAMAETFRYVGAPTPEADREGFRTYGDLGWLDEDGYLYIADRRADMVVTGGANVFPAEVEAALSEHAGVADVVVIGLPDEEWGRRLHAVVEPADPAAAPGADELRAFCKERLASYKVPKSFEVVDALPRTAAGKVNRSALAADRAESPAS